MRMSRTEELGNRADIKIVREVVAFPVRYVRPKESINQSMES